MSRTPRLDTLIFFVTSRCNARCRTCFYWKELNRPGDLTFPEIERLSSTMPRFEEIWFSGGEPSLREELAEIVSVFHRHNGVRSINLPVNGLLPHRLSGLVDDIDRRCPSLRVNVNVALDGIADTHDRIRGVPGNFRRALESLAALQERRARMTELRVHVNSVICSENIDEMVPLGELIRNRFDLDGHYFQIIRGEPMDPELLSVRREALARLHRDLQPLHRHYAEKLAARKRGLGAALARVSYQGVLKLYHQIQTANLDAHHPWPMPCTAGRNIVVLDANGDLRACELREKLGNVRELDCDWRRFWQSKGLDDEVAAIDRDGCWCTHVCFLHASLKESRKALYLDVPRAYWA